MESWTAIGARTYFATGIHEHHGVLTTFGAGPFVAGHTHFVLKRIGSRTVPVAPGDTERVIFGLRAGLADTLLATPSYAQYLANRLQGTAPDPRSFEFAPHHHRGRAWWRHPCDSRPHPRGARRDRHRGVGVGDVAPSLYGECPLQQGMHFSGLGHVWPELIDPDTQQPTSIETGAVGEFVYTTLTREAMPVVRFLGGDIIRVEGTSCECGRTSFRMRCIGLRDDMFIVRGVNVYPSAILSVVGEFRPRVTGRARVVRHGARVSVEPPVPIEVPAQHVGDQGLAIAMEGAVHTKLPFRAKIILMSETAFGESGYKTNLTVKRH
jgi:phenylacetate-CoA ligase